MIASGSLVSLILAVLEPTVIKTGVGFAVSVGLIAGSVVLMIGCIKYSRSKGYSGWVGFWLSLGLPSLIGLLILPDHSSVDSDDKT